MSPSEEQALAFLAQASADLEAAKVLNAAKSIIDQIVGFHCQQAVEKSLKAVLAANETDFPWTHNLPALSRLLISIGVRPPINPDQGDALTPWATINRYDVPSDVLDRAAVLELAEHSVTWARAQLDQIER